MSGVIWLGEARDGDVIALRVGRIGDELVAEWNGLGVLRVRGDGSGASFEANPDADPVDVAKLERGAVRLLLRHLEGKIGLHAASVAIDGRAVVLLGESGGGKSTLAAALCAQSAELLADDATALERTPEGWVVVPFENDHWLDADARARLSLDAGARDVSRDKIPVTARRGAKTPARAAMMVLLSFADVERPFMTRLAGIEIMAALVPLVMRFVVDDAKAQRRELDELADLVQAVSFHRLERPRDLSLLDATCDLVVQAMRS